MVQDLFWQEYQQSIDQVRQELLAGMNFSPSHPYQTGETQASLRDKMLSVLFYELELLQTKKLNAKTKEYYDQLHREYVLRNSNNEVFQYYAVDVANKREELKGRNRLVVDSAQSGQVVGQQKQPEITKIPDYAKRVIDSSESVMKTKDGWNNWKKQQASNNELPKPTELAHQTTQVEFDTSLQESTTTPPNEKKRPKLLRAWKSKIHPEQTKGATPQNQMSEKVNEMLKTFPVGSYKFFIEKLHGRGTQGPFQKNPIQSGLQPFEINNRMLFPAYIESFNDSYDASWSDYSFLGRGESVYAWSKTERTMTLNFWILSDFSSELLINAAKTLQNVSNKGTTDTGFKKGFAGKSDSLLNTLTTNSKDDITDEEDGFVPLNEQDLIESMEFALPDWGLGEYPPTLISTKGKSGFVPGLYSGTPEQLYNRVTFLSQCMYGWYRNDGKLKEQPFIRLRVTDFFDVVCKINNLSFGMDEFEVDLNQTTVGNIPMGIKVTMSLTIVHEDEPSSEYRKFYHRRDRDDNSYSEDTSANETSLFGDAALDAYQSKSPINLRNIANNKNNKSIPHDILLFQESLKSNNGALKDLKSTLQSEEGKDWKVGALKEKLSRALKAAHNLATIQAKVKQTIIKDKVIPSTSSSAATTTTNNNNSGNDLNNIPNLDKNKFPKFTN